MSQLPDLKTLSVLMGQSMGMNLPILVAMPRKLVCLIGLILRAGQTMCSRDGLREGQPVPQRVWK